MRVSVHQSKDRDEQSVPKLPHHQPAVYIWEPFTLTPHTQTHTYTHTHTHTHTDTHTHTHTHTHTLKYMHAWYWKML